MSEIVSITTFEDGELKHSGFYSNFISVEVVDDEITLTLETYEPVTLPGTEVKFDFVSDLINKQTAAKINKAAHPDAETV